MKSTKKHLAIFDIDGTVFRSSLGVELIHRLVKSGVFPKKANQELAGDYLAWLNRIGSYEKYVDQLIKIHLKYIGGCRVSSVDRAAHEIIREKQYHLYRFTRDFIRELKRKHYLLLAISGSPSYIVSQFAKKLGFHATYGTVLEIKKGKFTGRVLDDRSIARKSDIITEFIQDSGIDVDLRESIAVGDTESDLSMLEAVGKPIAFNPNRVLAKHAKRKGWQIIVERKDVIYDIKQFQFLSK